MRQFGIRFGILAFLAIVSLESPGHSGELNPPPGPIAPTNRVTINGPAITPPYQINQPGSYVVIGDIVATIPGQNGIEINASDVTLDLNGFTVRSVSAPGTGILTIGSQTNVVIHNGSVRDWGDDGLDLSSASASRVSAVRADRNSQHGIRLGTGSVVTDCIADTNGGNGIRVEGGRNRVEANHALNNGQGFVVVGIENLIVKNSAGNNGTDYSISAGNGHGPIVPASGDLATILNGNHPWANFGLSCTTTWCRDADGDTFGDPNDSQLSCTQPMGYVSDCTDCDDGNASVNPSLPDLCNLVDDDCNSGTPNGSSEPTLGMSCDGPDGDLCAEGAIQCTGVSLNCSDSTGTTSEVCNGNDDDCDGQVDEGLGTITCGIGQCQNTVPACLSGAPNNCVPNSPSTEVCDGFDNNCNGTTDEGNPGGGGVCNTGLLGVCAPGTVNCVSAQLTCIQNQFPSTEICDGLDNNCNGSTDEIGCQANGVPCSLGSQCLSGNCVDGVCCNSACNGVCQACSAAKKGSGPDGTCGNIGTGLDPDSECAGSATCNGGGACGLINGTACSVGAQCLSGFCVDGFCCNTPCSGLCFACSAVKSIGPNGTCAPVDSGTDPDNECSSFPSFDCDGNGDCGQ